MKVKSTLTFFALLAMTFLLMNNADGPGSVQDEDRTGSPLSSGACNVDGCHDAGVFNPSVTIELKKDNLEVDKYQPGETYNMKVTITASQGTPAAYGFQAVALKESNNGGAGSWGTIPAGMQSVTLTNTRTYVEHSTPNTASNSFECEWIAPQAGTGDVTFYAAGNAVNDDNDSSGDGAMKTQLTITEENPDGAKEVQLLSGFTIFPNPVQEVLNFKISSRYSGEFDFRITDVNGKILQSQRLELIEGENNKEINVSNLTNGFYLIYLVDGQKMVSQKMLKI
jgi:hypothetical protein